MSLLREIQKAAVDSSTPLPDVLRKCMVLAARLGHAPFKEWVEEELNGYPPGATLPAYRCIGGIISIGNFGGPLGAAINNVPIPIGPIPADLHDRYTTAEFREGVGQLQEMVSGQSVLISRWPGDLVASVADKYYEGYTLLGAHREIPKNAVIGALDSIRNKVLKFALEIEERNPEAGDAPPGSKPVPTESVSQIFNTFILGAQNVAVGSAGAVQHAQQLQVGDIAALRRFLTEHGVPAPDVAELEKAIADDGPSAPGEPSFGKRVTGWLGTMLSKAGSGVWKISTGAAADLLTAALKAYYGL